jgi:C_GCAxxG_C_C family probable redox protein
MTRSNKAANRFAQGYVCSQAVLTSFAEEFGLPEDVAFKVASAFGGGMARQGEVCGAVSGALMTLGLRFGTTNPDHDETVREVSQAFLERFRTENGSLRCRELLGHQLTTPEGLEAARESGAFRSVCPALVAFATQTTEALIRSQEAGDSHD